MQSMLRARVGAPDVKQIVAPQRLVLVHARGRARGHPDDRNVPFGPGEIHVAVAMVVTVQHQLGAVRSKDALQLGCIAQGPARRGLTGKGRMVDQHHSNEAFAVRALEQIGKRRHLLLPDTPRGDERRRFLGRVQANKRDGPNAAHERKAVGAPGRT